MHVVPSRPVPAADRSVDSCCRILANKLCLSIYLVLCISKQYKMVIKDKIVCMAQINICAQILKVLKFSTNKPNNFGTKHSEISVQTVQKFWHKIACTEFLHIRVYKASSIVHEFFQSGLFLFMMSLAKAELLKQQWLHFQAFLTQERIKQQRANIASICSNKNGAR